LAIIVVLGMKNSLGATVVLGAKPGNPSCARIGPPDAGGSSICIYSSRSAQVLAAVRY
jgi:hypothetical protein